MAQARATAARSKDALSLKPYITILASALALILALGEPQTLTASELENAMLLPATRAELSDRLGEAGLSRGAIATIGAAARGGLVLETSVTSDPQIPIGATKFGGAPDLPDGMSWPVRPAYDAADATARELRDQAANLYADAGLAPPFMSPGEAEALLAVRRRINDEAMAGTLEIMRNAGIDTNELELDAIPVANPDEIAAGADELLARAEAVGKPFPLVFLAQLDLEALSAESGFDPALPEHGRLLFFYDLPILPADYEPGARVGWTVIHDETAVSKLRRAAFPKELLEFPSTTRLRPATIKPRSVVTTVPTGDAAWQALQDVSGGDGALYHDWLSTLGWPTDEQGRNHQLGGWPRTIQAGMQFSSQLTANGINAGTSDAFRSEAAQPLLADAAAWRLVLQIGTDEALGYDLPGALNFLVHEEDLSSRRFDRAWVVYQQD